MARKLDQYWSYPLRPNKRGNMQSSLRSLAGLAAVIAFSTLAGPIRAEGPASFWAVSGFGPAVADGAGERIEGRLQGQGNVDDLRAVWRLFPLDPGHSLGKLELFIVASLPVPASLVTPELEFASGQAVSA